MPIRPENRARYPKDWALISKRVKERARWCCETCGLHHHDYYHRPAFGEPEKINGCVLYHHVKRLGHTPSIEYNDKKYVRIVLTTAHLDHVPENCGDDNLKALCQKCHNAYDAKIRRAGIAERARLALNMRDLFDE